MNRKQQTTNELWKDVEGYVGLYQVSNLGNVKSLSRIHRNGVNNSYIQKEKCLKQSFTTTGYKKVELRSDGARKSYKVHRLVAFAFLGKPPKNKRIVNHKDGNPLNNSVCNLEWCSHKHNMLHAILIGLKGKFFISRQELYNELVVQGNSVKEIAEMHKVTPTIIRNRAKQYGIRLSMGRKDQYGLTPQKLTQALSKFKTQQAIANVYGCTQSLISHKIKKYKRSGLF